MKWFKTYLSNRKFRRKYRRPLIWLEEKAITFFVAGKPVPQPRQRHKILKTRSGNDFVHNYTSKTHMVQGWKALVYYAAKSNITSMITGPVRLSLHFYLPKPKSVKRKYPFVKPDVDNLAKAVMDALTIASIYTDDARVIDMDMKKRYADTENPMGVHITIEEAA